MLSVGSCCNSLRSSPPDLLSFDIPPLEVVNLVIVHPRNVAGRAGQSLRQQLLSLGHVLGKEGATRGTKGDMLGVGLPGS